MPPLYYTSRAKSEDAWLEFLHRRVYQRRVSSEETMQIDRHLYYLGRKFAKQAVSVLVDVTEREFVVIDGTEF